MIPDGDRDLTTYLTELLRTNKSNQQNNTLWFPIPEGPGKIKDLTPIQTRILKELQQKDKLTQKDDAKSQMEFLKGFDWTDTLLGETEKQAVEDVLVDYHDIFARHRMDIGMTTEFKVKLTPKEDRAVYRQNLPMPIHLKVDSIVELAFVKEYGIITVLPFSKYASLIFAQRKPNGKLRLLLDLRKIKTLIADDYTKNNHPVSTLSDAAQHLAGMSLFCKFDSSQAYHCLHIADQRSVEMRAFSFSNKKLLLTKDLHKVSADLWLLFRASCACTWTQLLTLTIVLIWWTILELQPIILRNLPRSFGQSCSAFAKRDWNWKMKSAILESDNLNS